MSSLDLLLTAKICVHLHPSVVITLCRKAMDGYYPPYKVFASNTAPRPSNKLPNGHSSLAFMGLMANCLLQSGLWQLLDPEKEWQDTIKQYFSNNTKVGPHFIGHHNEKDRAPAMTFEKCKKTCYRYWGIKIQNGVKADDIENYDIPEVM